MLPSLVQQEKETAQASSGLTQRTAAFGFGRGLKGQVS